MTAIRDMFFEVPTNSSLEALESYGTGFSEQQRGVMWHLGDLARYAEARFPETWHQVFPEWISPGLIARAAAVAEAYPTEDDRNLLATWTIHMQNANQPDRIQRVQAHVDAGRTSDEARKADAAERKEGNRTRWLLAVDVNYHLHRHWFSGAGVEAASRVASGVDRLVKRLKEKGLTDVACCFDSPRNFRKELTADWEDKYKPRPDKDRELVQQITLVRELLDGRGFCCVMRDGFEADDLMASYAAQFDGDVTLLTPDKDMKQCLSDKCNMLPEITWDEDDTSGDMLPEYHWYIAEPSRKLTELRQKRAALPDGHASIPKLDKAIEDATYPNLLEDTGLRPGQWAAYQAIWGDGTDGIKGCPGIGEKGALELIQDFGTVAGAIQAAKDDDERITPKKREALIAFEQIVAVTMQLVTLRINLELPTNTRI